MNGTVHFVCLAKFQPHGAFYEGTLRIYYVVRLDKLFMTIKTVLRRDYKPVPLYSVSSFEQLISDICKCLTHSEQASK